MINTDLNSPIRSVIFDCDGTLIDSERLCLQAIKDTLESIGILIEYDWLKAHFQGVKIHRIFGSILEQQAAGESHDIDVLIRRFRIRSNELFELDLEPIDGVVELLDELTKRDIEVCIASNAPLEKMDVSLTITNLMSYFEGKIFSAFEANAWKPEPKLLHVAMEHLGRRPEECLFIDDSIVGVEAGINAKVKTLYLVRDAQAHKDHVKHPLVSQIQDIRECLQFL